MGGSTSSLYPSTLNLPLPAFFDDPRFCPGRDRNYFLSINCLPLMTLQICSTSPLLHPRLSSLRLLLAEKPSPCVTPLHPFQFSKMAGSKNRQDLLSIHMAAPCLSSQVTQERLFNSPVLCLPTLMQLQKEKLQKPYYSKIRIPSC